VSEHRRAVAGSRLLHGRGAKSTARKPSPLQNDAQNRRRLWQPSRVPSNPGLDLSRFAG